MDIQMRTSLIDDRITCKVLLLCASLSFGSNSTSLHEKFESLWRLEKKIDRLKNRSELLSVQLKLGKVSNLALDDTRPAKQSTHRKIEFANDSRVCLIVDSCNLDCNFPDFTSKVCSMFFFRFNFLK